MKVKVTLKFRGREMAHTEYGFLVVRKFLTEIAAYGHPDSDAKLAGRAINVMISPLPRNKRAKHPQQVEEGATANPPLSRPEANHEPAPERAERPAPVDEPKQVGAFSNNPFAQLEVKR